MHKREVGIRQLKNLRNVVFFLHIVQKIKSHPAEVSIPWPRPNSSCVSFLAINQAIMLDKRFTPNRARAGQNSIIAVPHGTRLWSTGELFHTWLFEPED
jgi:hypothetical protein